MYQVSLFNNNVETVVHYPSSNQDDPHVTKLPLKEGLSVVDSLSFSLYPNNQGFTNVFELTTKVRTFDVRDNTTRFTGRVLGICEKMDNDGKLYKEITCEGALSYLNDSKQRGSSFYAESVSVFLSQILSIHNSKVEPAKQIQVGDVNVGGNVIHTCNYKTTLAEILEVRKTTGGDIRVRETNGVLYLDWLTSFSSNTLEVSLGVNMKDMVVSKDVTSLGTRIVPLGANNLTIETVNNGIDYIEDQNAKNLYGVIEKTVEYRDIEDATTLFNTCMSDLPTHTQPSYVLESNALDLSYLSGNKSEQFVLSVSIHLINQLMGVDAIYKVVALDLDLLTPYNPTLTIANKPLTLTNEINDLRDSTIQNDGVYNNVQIGRSYGIRVVRSDNKVVTTMNATQGINIENQNKRVFYVDIDGNLVAVDIKADNMKAKGGTFEDITVNRGTFNDITTNNMTAKGGTFDDITANRGTFNDMTSERGKFNNMTAKQGTMEDVNSSRGVFSDITVQRGSFNDINVLRGTFDDIAIVNGLTIEDDTLTCAIKSLGITLTRGSYTGTLSVDDTIDALSCQDTFYVKKDLGVDGVASFAGDANFDANVNVGGQSIESLMDERIKALVKAESLK